MTHQTEMFEMQRTGATAEHLSQRFSQKRPDIESCDAKQLTAKTPLSQASGLDVIYCCHGGHYPIPDKNHTSDLNKSVCSLEIQSDLYLT